MPLRTVNLQRVPSPGMSARARPVESCLDPGGYAFGMNFIESEFTQWRVFVGVKRSPMKTWPR